MTVYLVGAGPGDPGLLTVRGAEVLARADVVVHDRLAEASLLDLAPPGAERIDVGKAPGGPVRQSSIDRLLVERGRAGEEVVRLKGGDPFVFGRGGEEALALQAAGVAFEVVPGVTSAVAVPAYAGIPVTHRGLATSFTVVTGHSRHAVDRETNWEALAAAGGTIVILMGVAHREAIARRLIAGGLDPATLVAAVRWGSRPEQQTVRTTLAELGAAPLQPPSTIVIGAVAGLHLGWYERRPLLGRRVVVTRAASQASGLSARLRELGAEPIEIPAIRIAPPGDDGVGLDGAAAAVRAGRYEWVAFTSANGVAPLFDRLHDARDLAATQVAAVGPGTAAALAARGVVADLVPLRSIAEGLLEAWPPLTVAGAGMVLAPPGERPPAVLLVLAAGARPVLADGLSARGWAVDVVEGYRSVPEPLEPPARAGAASADAICFTSASTVRNYLATGAPLPLVVVCIGPETAAAAAAGGVRVTAVAEPHSLDGLLACLIGVLGVPDPPAEGQ